MDLVPLPIADSYSADGEARADQIKLLHEQVRDQIMKHNLQYQTRANKHRKRVVFEEGDLVWIFLRKERFPSGRYGKLQDRADGPFRVLRRINDNAYKIDLPGNYGVSATFNVADLAPYTDDDVFVFPTVAKIDFVRPKQQEKPVRKPVKYAEMYRLTAITIKGKGWPKAVNTARPNSAVVNVVRANQGHPQKEDQGYVDSGCSRHMTGNMSYLSDFKEFDGGYVTFGGGAKGGKITGKGTLKTADESHVLLKVPRKNNMYSVDIKNIIPKESLTCLVAKATLDESICDNGTEFKNRVMSDFCKKKGIKREFSVARTPQQNGVAERRNRTLIKAATCTNSNDSVSIKESVGTGHSSKETGSSQDYILMPLWKDSSLFDSSLMNASNDEPQPSSDAGKMDDEGVSQESGIDDQERPENSTQDVNTIGPSINIASTNVNTSSLNINTISPTVTTAPLEATHADFFGDETELDMSNITTTYLVPTTPNTRIHKDHSLDHVIGDV
ncbi:putative ribonuclease H-like domain-containing protein [Tanacetum coccineum]